MTPRPGSPAPLDASTNRPSSSCSNLEGGADGEVEMEPEYETKEHFISTGGATAVHLAPLGQKQMHNSNTIIPSFLYFSLPPKNKNRGVHKMRLPRRHFSFIFFHWMDGQTDGPTF